MKETELHPQIVESICQNKKREKPIPKTLMDVYYDESKLLKWRDSCIKHNHFLEKKIKAFADTVQNALSKFETLRALKNEMTSLKNMKMSLVQLIHTYSKGNSSSDRAINKILDALQQLRSQLEKSSVGNSLLLTRIGLDFFKTTRDLLALDRDITELVNKQIQVKKDISTLLKPSFFFESYPAILREVNRRQLFNQVMSNEVEKLNKVIQLE